MRKILYLTAMMLLVGSLISNVYAQTPKSKQIVLKATTFLPVSQFEPKMFIELVEEINKKAKDELFINVLGGPEVIPAVEQVSALRKGVVDFAVAPTSYYEIDILPEAGSIVLTKDTPWDQRKSGYFDIMVELHKKINTQYIARLDPPSGFYIFTKVSVKDPRKDFRALKIRSVAEYSLFLDVLGCAKVTVPRVDIYTAMERGVIDGFISNAALVKGLAQHEVSKYVILPKFYQSNCVVWMNLETWNRLPKHLQDLISKTAAEYEYKWWEKFTKVQEEALEWLTTKGKLMKIEFSPDDAKWYLDQAYNTAWKKFLDRCPESGPKLKKIMGY